MVIALSAVKFYQSFGSVEFLSVSNDVTWTTGHEPALTEDVCTTFM